MLGRLVQPLASLLILAGLIGLAWWGRHTEWGSHVAPVSPPPDEADIDVVRTPEATRLRFPSPEAVRRAGVEFAAAYVGPIDEAIDVPAAVAYDATRQARLSARAAGTVTQVRKRVGERVEAGDVLAVIDAPDVASARSEVAQARLQVDARTRTLDGLRRGLVPDGRLREAEASLAEAQTRLTAGRQSLAALGQPPDGDGGLLPVVAPLGGDVLACDAVAGVAVEAGRTLFVVGDPRRLWLRLAIRPEDAPRVRPGQAVRFGTANAVVEWVAPAADEVTRTVEARATLDNKDGRHRVNALGRARVVLRAAHDAVLVPAVAIQGGVVLVRDRGFLSSDEKVLHVRPVRVGATDGDQAEVASGLRAGEVVVTTGAARLLDAVRRNATTGGD